MAGNQLCGLDLEGDGTYTAEGITKLCEGLKGSTVTSLKCAAPPPSAFMSAPIDTPTLSPFLTLPLARSLGGNAIGKEGITVLAAILKETEITELKCAAAPECLACLLSCQRPLTHLYSPFPFCPSLAVSISTALEARASLRSLPSSTRRRSLT